MKKNPVVKKVKKNDKTNTSDPKITLVGEFRGSNIYIMWDKYKAKEFSEYMELWFQALRVIDDKFHIPWDN